MWFNPCNQRNIHVSPKRGVYSMTKSYIERKEVQKINAYVGETQWRSCLWSTPPLRRLPSAFVDGRICSLSLPSNVGYSIGHCVVICLKLTTHIINTIVFLHMCRQSAMLVSQGLPHLEGVAHTMRFFLLFSKASSTVFLLSHNIFNLLNCVVSSIFAYTFDYVSLHELLVLLCFAFCIT